MSNLRRIFKLMKKYNVFLALAIVISFFTAIVDLAEPYILGEIVESLGGNDSTYLLIWIYGILMLFGKLVDAFHGFIVEWYNAKAIETIRNKAIQWILQRRKFGKMPFEQGDIVSRLNSDVDAITQMLASPLNGLVPDILTGIGAFIILWKIHWGIASLVMVVLPIFYYVTKKVNATSKKNALANRKIRASMTSYFMDFVKNYCLYSCYDGRKAEEARSMKLESTLTRNVIKQSTNMLSYFISVGGLRCVVILVSLLILEQSISIGDIGAGTIIMVVSYIQNVFLPVLQLSRYVNQVAQSNVAVQRVFDLEPTEEECIGEFSEFQGEHIQQLNVQNLSISYGEKNVVENINFNIKGPGLVCLYGRSGSGKSTILHALCGLIPVENGRIRVNEKDYTEHMLDLVLEKKIRVVFQESFLFDRSLKENIVYGIEKECDEEVFMLKMGKRLGLEYILENSNRNVHNGLNGATISGGEQRRIALMRGVNQRADIYLLDEPTSELDKESAQLVISLIDEMKREKIVVVSTHDSAFIDIADCVVKV